MRGSSMTTVILAPTTPWRQPSVTTRESPRTVVPRTGVTAARRRDRGRTGRARAGRRHAWADSHAEAARGAGCSGAAEGEAEAVVAGVADVDGADRGQRVA